MQYNYESIAEELLVAFDKKLVGNQKLVKKQMAVLFDFLGDRLPYETRKQLEQVIEDHLTDGNKSQSALFVQTLHKVVRAIREVTHE
jgi:hypothetical protein